MVINYSSMRTCCSSSVSTGDTHRYTSVKEKGVVISYLRMCTCARNISLQKLSPKWFQSSKMLVVSHTYRNKTMIYLNWHLQDKQYPTNISSSMIRISIPSVNEKGVVISNWSMHTCARILHLRFLGLVQGTCGY